MIDRQTSGQFGTDKGFNGGEIATKRSHPTMGIHRSSIEEELIDGYID